MGKVVLPKSDLSARTTSKNHIKIDPLYSLAAKGVTQIDATDNST